MDFGVNWVTPGYKLRLAESTGTSSLFSPAGNDPGFVSMSGNDYSPSGNDYHLSPSSSALGLGQALAPAVTSNFLGLDLTPVLQYTYPASPTALPGLGPRTLSGAGSDLGAFGR
jgi:hypothetical protein